MATLGASGSTLASLAARRLALQKSRERLGLNPGGVGSVAPPQANVRPPAPATPTQPKAPETPSPTAAPAAPPQQAQLDPKLLEQARQFIEQVKSQGRAVAPAPPPIQYAPPSVPPPLSQQIEQVGAAGLSPVMQAMRIFGRPPSAREMVIFNATRALEQQLGRPPTRNEILMHITRPGALSSGPEPVAG